MQKPELKLKKMLNVLEDSTITKADFITYFYLVLISKNEECQISISELAKKTHQSLRQIFRSVENLDAKDYIQIEKTFIKQSRGTNRYIIK